MYAVRNKSLKLSEFLLGKYHCIPITSSFRRFMEVWSVDNIGSHGTLDLITGDKPVVNAVNDVLVEVHATSVNPLDVRMMNGYGKDIFGVLHTVQSQLQGTNDSLKDRLVLGRDFSGVITEVGQNICKNDFKPGDEVWGIVDPTQKHGCHADYVLANSKMIQKKPPHLSHIEAASFPFAAMTAWSALSTVGFLSQKNAAGKKILLLGASGGVGSFALQLLKYWNAEVISVCSSVGKSTVEALGSDITFDYQFDDVKRELFHHKHFDYIFDFTGIEGYDWTLDLLKTNSAARYITVLTPLIKDIDEMNILGPAKSLFSLAKNVVPSLAQGKLYQWAFFIPNLEPLKIIDQLTASNIMKPIINQVYSFYDLPSAYDATSAGSIVGKNVIDMKNKIYSEETGENIFPDL